MWINVQYFPYQVVGSCLHLRGGCFFGVVIGQRGYATLAYGLANLILMGFGCSIDLVTLIIVGLHKGGNISYIFVVNLFEQGGTLANWEIARWILIIWTIGLMPIFNHC